MSFIIEQALRGIRCDRSLLLAGVSSNRQIYSEEVYTIPDMQVTITPLTAKAAETQVLWLVESGFSQTQPAIFKKIEHVIMSHNEIELALIIIINEQTKYVPPAENSAAWNQTCLEKSVRSYSDFAPLRTPDKLFGPVGAIGHAWIDISSIEYSVWLKPTGAQHINMAADPTASGTLFPDLNMEEVGQALSRGVDLVKAAMCCTLDLIEPSVNHQHLLTPTALEFEWGTEYSFMSHSIYKTAYFRYFEWYRHHFSGTKHHRADSPTEGIESARPSTKRAYGNVSSSESRVQK
ncbi:hypothetical protein AZE42_02648 [Rhizopogon vesiculosus]|uniref:Uncharacterized protein n=1 Tax=Rhizopogon vesiculosus TaxID=180088 RepID=A0A1J8Q2V6_9AGAM|nr:hypothetical protein AZE42_02648 [Rhizopogon vesiculosus]